MTLRKENNQKTESCDSSFYKNKIIDDLILEIKENHEKILDDWYKAHLADQYQRCGQISPCDFILRKEPVFKKNKQTCGDFPCFAGYKYWFEKKN